MSKNEIFVLTLLFQNRDCEVAAFESEDSARSFARKIPGYYAERYDKEFNPVGRVSDLEADVHFANEGEDGFVILEYIDPTDFPDYVEVVYNSHVVPFSGYMFSGKESIQIYYKKIINLDIGRSAQRRGESAPANENDAPASIISGAVIVDAYAIENENLRDYIERRESGYKRVKAALESRGFEVARAYRGSEDGEAIVYRAKNTDGAACDLNKRGDDCGSKWRFFDHLDPAFVYETPEKDAELEELLDSLLGIGAADK